MSYSTRKVYFESDLFHYHWLKSSKPLQKCSLLCRFQFEYRRFPLIAFFSKSIIKVVSTSSICRDKPICNSNIPPSKPVSASFVRASKPISNRNVDPSKTVSASSVRPVFHGSACASKPICAINVRVSKPVSGHNSVSDVRSSEPSNSNHARLSNIVSASNISPSKTVSASNVCPGKPVCTNYVRQSRSICGSEVCQSKPTSDIVIFIINLFVQTIFVLLIHLFQLNRYLYFYFPF